MKKKLIVHVLDDDCDSILVETLKEEYKWMNDDISNGYYPIYGSKKEDTRLMKAIARVLEYYGHNTNES